MQTADEDGVLVGMSPTDQATLARLNALLDTEGAPLPQPASVDVGMFGDADEE
jgi:hypothetical protein